MKKETIGNATLYLGDCMDYMKDLGTNAFDLAIVDPPYFDGPGSSGYYGKGYSSIGVSRGEHHDQEEHWEIPTKEYFTELKRVSKNQIIWGANHFAGLFDSSSPGWIVWDKCRSESSFADAELAYTSFDRHVEIALFPWNGMIQGKEVGSRLQQGNKSLNEDRIHPTQKPVKLYEWLLNMYAKEGDKILDTHHGSGSISVACNSMGFEITGVEKDINHHNAACKRIDQAQRQGRLFA